MFGLKEAFRKLSPEKLVKDMEKMTKELVVELYEDLEKNSPPELLSGFKFMSSEDERVCPRCARLHGMVFPDIDKAHKPPIHPNCRCWTIDVKFDPLTMKLYKEGGEVSYEHTEIFNVEYGTPTQEAIGFFRRTIINIAQKFGDGVAGVINDWLGQID